MGLSFQTKLFLLALLFVVSPGIVLNAQKTETMYLSGTGSDQTVDWDFKVSDGMNSGEWTQLPVPSNWEQFEFGTYSYGHTAEEDRGKEIGFYKHEFVVPKDWKDKKIKIIFEGSMTDTQVKINGKLAGAVHQGAFYRFEYDISKLLNFDGSENLLEVRVAKHSENESVNAAEREGDFWIFGGIFRPVYLSAKPVKNIERVAIDAKADGKLRAEVFLNGRLRKANVVAQIFDAQQRAVGPEFSVDIISSSNSIVLQQQFNGIKTWNPENPNLYSLEIKLMYDGKTVHHVHEKFGFRTVDLRKGDGIYVNGVKIKFKGVNRHTFWPTTGRASSKKRSIADINLIKDMNMNAVRMSHYPPNTHFLDVADSLGLFVLNELAGWHGSYDTPTGSRLVEAMVKRDVNHPSVVFWNNGNEGGHNTDLDTLFQHFDIQKREVIHPWQHFNGMANEHYRPYNYGAGTYWNGREVVFPTEFLHGMYDGGLGAGLYDYWELIWDNPRAAGGFLWVFADEGIERTDTGEIDTYNGSAADGILGPFHQKEASYYAIKELWAPVRFQDIHLTSSFDGQLPVENRYFYTNLKELNFSWTLEKLPIPSAKGVSKQLHGTITAPDVAPRQKGSLSLELPSNWLDYEVLYVNVTDNHGRELFTWSWPIKTPKEVLADFDPTTATETDQVKWKESANEITVKAGEVTFVIGKQDGQLKKVENKKGEIPFNNGPHLSAGVVDFKSLHTEQFGDSLVIRSSFEEKSRMKEFSWVFYPSGWLKLEVLYKPEFYDVDFDYMGVDFSYPEALVEGVEWLGKGPYRVWKNRIHGTKFAIHQKQYNNTITGVSPMVYPEFKGYHANLYWAKINSKSQSFVVATETQDVFLRLFTPEYAQNVYEARTSPSFPSQDISFMQAIPAIGSKTNQPERLGPSGQKNIFFDYGTFDNWKLRSKKMTLFFNFSSGW